MAGLSHTFSCTIADGSATNIVRPSDWNAAHTVAAGTAAYGFVPVGGVIAWAGTIAAVASLSPGGWLVCDGSEYSTTTYAGLYAVVGTMFGSGSGTFKVPDLRDKFIAGANSDDGGVPKSNIRGSLEQSIAVTGVTLTHDGSVSDHTGLTHAGAAVGTHPDLTHPAIGIADHPSTSMTISVGAQTTINNAATSAAANTIGVTASTHAVTGATRAAITHEVTADLSTVTHASGTYGTHAITQPNAHGTAGTVSHSFTAPASHTPSIVPSFLAMCYIIRYA